MRRDVEWRDTTVPWERASEGYRDDVRALWQAACLRYKLDPSQAEVYDEIKRALAGIIESADREYVLDIGRRWGKSTLLCVMAVEMALKSPHGRIPYAASTQIAVRTLLLPIMRKVHLDCPPELRPTLNVSTKEWTYPNGATIAMVGCDKNPDALRGPAAAMALGDECGYIVKLEYVIEDVLRPQLMTSPNAFLLLGSTPPTTPGHAWSARYVPEAKRRGLCAHRTIEDNPRITVERREAYIAKAGGRTATKCRREYFAEHVIEEDLAIIPEFQAVKADVVCEVERPQYYDAYVAMDPGWTHLCVVLFGYLDFLKQRVVIEADYSARHATTKDVAHGIRKIEAEIWGTDCNIDGKPQPHGRYSDTDMRLIQDLWSEYRIHFSPTRKDERDHAIAQTRVWMGEKRIWIHPRCTTLIAHLDHGIWNPSRKQFAETEEDGHYDAVAALVYLMRNVSWRRNPYPALPDGVVMDTHHISPEATRRPDETARAMAGMFKRRHRQ